MSASRTFLIAAKIHQTILENYRFTPHLTTSQILQLIDFAFGLEIKDESLIHDLICTANRKGKALTVEVLKEQMRNYMQVIQPRAYPYGFPSHGRFLQFQQAVVTLLTSFAIPVQDIRIHGSALRTPKARDIDLLVVLDGPHFRRLSKFLHGKPSQRLNQQLKILAQAHGLTNTDLLIVEDHTYFPNRPYMPFTLTR